jgi:hypothetical protein
VGLPLSAQIAGCRQSNICSSGVLTFRTSCGKQSEAFVFDGFGGIDVTVV